MTGHGGVQADMVPRVIQLNQQAGKESDTGLACTSETSKPTNPSDTSSYKVTIMLLPMSLWGHFHPNDHILFTCPHKYVVI